MKKSDHNNPSVSIEQQRLDFDKACYEREYALRLRAEERADREYDLKEVAEKRAKAAQRFEQGKFLFKGVMLPILVLIVALSLGTDVLEPFKWIVELFGF